MGQGAVEYLSHGSADIFAASMSECEWVLDNSDEDWSRARSGVNAALLESHPPSLDEGVGRP